MAGSRFQNVINDFSAGVLSPRLTMRGNLDRYRSGLKEAVNFIVSPQGGAVYREGMKFVGIPAQDTPFRVFTFHRGGDESDILLEITAAVLGVVKYWVDDEEYDPGYVLDLEPAGLLIDEDDGLTLLDANDSEELVDESAGDSDLAEGELFGLLPYFLSHLPGLYFTNQEYLGIICHGERPPVYITLNKDGTISERLLPFSDVPLTEYNDEKSPSQIGGTVDYNILFQNFTDNDRYFISYAGTVAMTPFPEPIPIEWVFISGQDSKQQTDIQGGLELIQGIPGVQPVTVVTAGSEYAVQLIGSNAGRQMSFPVAFSSNPAANITITQTGLVNRAAEPAWSFPYVVQHNGIWYKAIAPHTSSAATEPGVGVDWEEVWEFEGLTEPLWWDWQHGGSNDWAVDTEYSPWDRGFPTVAVFHEQRLIFAANKDAGTTFWGSRIGFYDDFVGGPNAADPIEFSLDTSDTPTIKWAQSQLNLMFGTSSGDWNIGAEKTLAPNDINAVKQNNARSRHTRPAVVDTEIFYIEQGDTKLRATRYVRNYDAFTSVDASLLSEHLLYRGITRIQAQYVPEVLLHMVTTQGDMRFLTYERNSGSAAWSAMETNGEVYDAATYYTTRDNIFSDKGNQDVVYVAVNRTNGWFLEKMDYPSREWVDIVPLAAQEISHLDGWSNGIVAGFPEGDGITIGGLDHLEGETVQAIIEDALMPGVFVVDNGTITLPQDSTGKWYSVGMPYAGKMTTYEVVDEVNGGVGYGMKRRWNELVLRVLDSAVPKINGDLPRERTPDTPMGTPETYRLGLQDLDMMFLGHTDGSVTIEAAGPYPLHVLGYYGEYTSFKR